MSSHPVAGYSAKTAPTPCRATAYPVLWQRGAPVDKGLTLNDSLFFLCELPLYSLLPYRLIVGDAKEVVLPFGSR